VGTSAKSLQAASDVAFRRWAITIVPAALAALAVFAFLARTTVRSEIGFRHRAFHAPRTATSAQLQSWADSFGDGTPDFLRLTDPADQAAFRRWFTLIAEYQAVRPKSQVPPEIKDCASLLRYSFQEALMRHDENWFAATGIEVAAPPGEIRAWTYPHTPSVCVPARLSPEILPTEPSRSLPMRKPLSSATLFS
jgi:hypothetical protein